MLAVRLFANVYAQAWELLTTKRPWEKCTDIVQIITAVLVMNQRLELPATVPDEMVAIPDLIRDCWQANLSHRLLVDVMLAYGRMP